MQAFAATHGAGTHLRRVERREGIVVGGAGRVLVDVYVRGRVGRAASRLRSAGMRVDATTGGRGAFRIVEGRLSRRALLRAARLGAVRAVIGVPRPILSVGAKTSQGDAAHRAPQARALGPTGSGVDVGIISDSINQVGGGVADSQSTGDLPPNVTILSDQSGGTDEGRAMAEIAYDEAPGIARILFGSATGIAGPVGKAALIDNLVSHGADVIADDTSFLTEPFFQDGVVGLAVDRARAQGTAYFAAAGNLRQQSWEGTFRPSGSAGLGGGPLHNFQSGSATDVVQGVVNVPPADTLTVVLQWDEPYGHAETDLDLYLVDVSNNAVVGSPGVSDNVTMGTPFEVATFTNNTGSSVGVGAAVERFAGSRTPFMKYIANGDFGTFDIAEYPTNSDAIAPDAATSRGAITVGAVRADEPGLDDVENFSSRGPKTILFDANGNRLATPEVRVKPDIAAADRVSTTVPFFDPFSGTSAAAPSAAGVAALLLSANPSLGSDGVRAIMTDQRSTNDCNPVGEPDIACGFGFPFADSALQLAQDASPPTVASTVTPPGPDGQNGWYTGDVSVSWTVTDPDSPVFATTGCGSATVTADTAGTTLDCHATSAGGTSTGSVRIQRDATPPTAPVIRGITARTYERAFLPAPSAISCSANDPTSGIEPRGCQTSGYSSDLGDHTLTATARNNAGLISTSTLAYRVVRTRPAVTRLSAPRKISVRGFLRHGLLARVTVARPGTLLAVKLIGPRGVTVGRLARRAGAGRVPFRLRPGARGKRLLRNRRRTSVTLSLRATPRVGAPVTLRRKLTIGA